MSAPAKEIVEVDDVKGQPRWIDSLSEAAIINSANRLAGQRSCEKNQSNSCSVFFTPDGLTALG